MGDDTSPHHHRWDNIDGPLLNYIVSQVLFYEPSTSVALLQVSSKFHQAAAKCLYEELYIYDEDDAIHSPPRNTRLEATLRYSQRYAGLVRTLILVPSPLALQASVSSLAISLPSSSVAILPESLGALLKALPRLESFVWATDRMPFRSICSVLYNAAPQLVELLFRPTISEQAHSKHRLASQEPTSSGPAPIPLRWDAFLMLNLASLRTLYISGLSIDGIRELQKCLQRSARLAVLTIDSQFVDDTLLLQIAELKSLRKLLIKSSGTKMTDKGILAILEKSETLQSLSLTEVEGRLHRSFWGNAISLPCSFNSLRLAFSEEGPHHSWIADHLTSVFDVLEIAPNGLKTLSITRLTPKGDFFPVTHHTQEGMVLNNGNGSSSGEGVMLKRVFSSTCDDIVRPKLLPDQALNKIIKYGSNLEILELDMYVMSLAELKSVVESCKKLRTLRILLDAPLTKVLSMSSSFVSLTQLHTLVLSITDAHCPNQTLVVKTSSKGQPTTTPPSAYSISASRRPSDIPSTGSVPELSPASTHASSAQSEPEPVSPTSSPRRSIASARRSSVSVASAYNLSAKSAFDDIAGVSVQGIQGSVGSFDTSISPKRDIRKLARRCPSLRILRWTGRNGKGEWRIAAGSSSIHAHIDFAPIHLVEDEELELITLGSGADVEDFIKRRRTANLPYPGKRVVVEEMDIGVLTLKDKDTEVTPRVDGRHFPRLRVNTMPASHIGELSADTNARVSAGKKKNSVGESFAQTTESKQTAIPAPPSVPLVKTPRKAAKSYADISDPALIKGSADLTVRMESKMTILGESNRKKASTASSSAATASTPIKQRTVTKVRGPEDVFSGATIIIGQGKGTTAKSGPAVRREKKKVNAKQSEETVASATSTSETATSKKNKNHSKRHM